MRTELFSGWFDNQMTDTRELWNAGEIQRVWPRVEIESSPHFDPWGTYPDLPEEMLALQTGMVRR